MKGSTLTGAEEACLDALGNPVWSSLTTRHRAMARIEGEVARFPAEIAPFLAVARAGSHAGMAEAIDALVAHDETIYLLGTAPELPPAWSMRAYAPLAQMECDSPIEVVDGPDAIELDDAHRADVLELTALVYPHYFRPRTMAMGRYFGIYREGRLAAMIGERLGTDAHAELSAICTHPDFLGRGYARRLVALLANDNRARGRLPFLHVSRENRRALEMYERIGFRHRPGIGFWSLRRT